MTKADPRPNAALSPAAAANEEARRLLAGCTRWLTGHPRQSTRDLFSELADYCATYDVRPDNYGDGAVIRDLEAEVAALLGKASAVFMPSGTMAQQIAMRIWSDERHHAPVGMHPTCHMELHEQRGYARLHGLNAVLLGSPLSPLTAADLDACPETLAAAAVELPMRELGGLLPSWDELGALTAAARRRGIRVHLDGARLWETGPFYARPYAEICAGFDSVYVSFYKGLGAVAGAILAGDEAFIASARIWQRRHGGNLFQLLPYVVSARLNLTRRLPRMPHYCAEARRVAAVLAGIPGLHLRPLVPQANMVHVHFDCPPAALRAARDELARRDRVWLLGGANAVANPNASYTELSFGDAAAAFTDAEIAALMTRLTELASAPEGR